MSKEKSKEGKTVEIVEGVDQFIESQVSELKEKIEATNDKLTKFAEKLKKLDEMTVSQKSKVAFSKARSLFNKQHKAVFHLQAVGSDFESAIQEGLKSYRVSKIKENYDKAITKLQTATANCVGFASAYPAIIDVQRLAIVELEVPPLEDAHEENATKRTFRVVTPEGVKDIVISIGDM